jgi:quinol monooxygenase YgiN
MPHRRVTRGGASAAISPVTRRRRREMHPPLFALTMTAMPTSSKSKTRVTLINVFTVEPHNQQRLIDLLTEATEISVRHAPGFISARLHRSLDGTKVTMYAEWSSAAAYQAMRADPAPLPYLQQALAIARFEPGMYSVVKTFCPPSR